LTIRRRSKKDISVPSSTSRASWICLCRFTRRTVTRNVAPRSPCAFARSTDCRHRA
jgi:hypothetical protein